MIKETKKEIIKVEREFYCDICHKKINLDYLYEHISCHICKRHLCVKHRINDNNDQSDYPVAYCPDCYKTVEKYNKELSIIEEEFDKKTEQVIDKMKKECLENIKKDLKNE